MTRREWAVEVRASASMRAPTPPRPAARYRTRRYVRFHGLPPSPSGAGDVPQQGYAALLKSLPR